MAPMSLISRMAKLPMAPFDNAITKAINDAGFATPNILGIIIIEGLTKIATMPKTMSVAATTIKECISCQCQCFQN